MDFSFSEEQLMLRESVARLLQNNYDFEARQTIVNSDQPWSAGIWDGFKSLGLLELPFPEAKGGFDGKPSDIAGIAEVFGEYLLVEPYLSSILLGGQLLALGNNANANEILAEVLSGDKTAAFAHEEGKGTPHPSLVAFKASKNDAGFVLSGEKRMVFGAAQADTLIVSARTDGSAGDSNGLALFMLDPAQNEITLTSFQTIDGRAAAHISIDNLAVAEESLIDSDAFAAIETVISGAMIALCAEAVGAMGALLKLSSEYATTRKQFGKPIASFQAISHKLADMKIACTKARATMIYTAALADSGKVEAGDISILKGQIGKLGKFIGETAIQVYGGVGMTDELSAGHFHKRLLAIDTLFGDSEYHLRTLGKL